MDKKERTVIHLQMGDNHYYFGCLASIYDMFSPEEIGITYGNLRNYVVKPDKPFENDKVIIRKGVLIPSKHHKTQKLVKE